MRRLACASEQSDQRLCCYLPSSIIPLISISEISSLYLSSVAEQAGLSLSWSKTPKTGFLVTWLNIDCRSALYFFLFIFFFIYLFLFFYFFFFLLLFFFFGGGRGNHKTLRDGKNTRQNDCLPFPTAKNSERKTDLRLLFLHGGSYRYDDTLSGLRLSFLSC